MSSGDGALQSSITDMMTSLMVIFILLLVNYLNETQLADEAAAAAPKEARESIKELLQERLSGEDFKGVVVKEDETDPYQLVVIIPEELLFSTGVSELSPKAHSFLEGFSPRFASVICGEDFFGKIQSFVIEGYTDTDPIRGQPLGNLRLSQSRSFSVMTKLLETSGNTESCYRKLSSASGRGEEGCTVKDASDQEAKARCRRVDFRIRVKSEKALELAQVGENQEDLQQKD